MTDRDKLRELLFHDPKGAMATMVVREDPDEEAMMTGYQAMTVLCVWFGSGLTIQNWLNACDASSAPRCSSGEIMTA